MIRYTDPEGVYDMENFGDATSEGFGYIEVSCRVSDLQDEVNAELIRLGYPTESYRTACYNGAKGVTIVRPPSNKICWRAKSVDLDRPFDQVVAEVAAKLEGAGHVPG